MQILFIIFNYLIFTMQIYNKKSILYQNRRKNQILLLVAASIVGCMTTLTRTSTHRLVAPKSCATNWAMCSSKNTRIIGSVTSG